MKNRCISYSEFSTFYEDPNKYYKEYIIGLREKPNKPMMFGSIIHKMFEDEKYDYNKALQEAGFTPDYNRIADTIKKNAPSFPQHEVKLFADTNEFTIFSIIDGVDEQNLIEIKTGASHWDQTRADESDQITMYTLAWWLKNNEIKPFKLITISSKNGKIKELKTSRTKEQIEQFADRLLQFKKDLIARGWWDLKCPSEERITIC
jgi:hypothetical protein